MNGLYARALGEDIKASDELSKIALGGFQLARDLVKQMHIRFTVDTGKNTSANLEKET